MPTSAYEKYIEGMALLEEERRDDALAVFHESLAIEEHFKTCERIAEILDGLGRAAEAEAYILRAFQLNSDSSKVATKHAKILFARGKTGEARQVLRDVLRENPTYGPAKRLLCSQDT